VNLNHGCFVGGGKESKLPTTGNVGGPGGYFGDGRRQRWRITRISMRERIIMGISQSTNGWWDERVDMCSKPTLWHGLKNGSGAVGAKAAPNEFSERSSLNLFWSPGTINKCCSGSEMKPRSTIHLLGDIPWARHHPGTTEDVRWAPFSLSSV
jgi:hypothetical protein